ncbi:hypothetical protein ACJX0J_016819 [Zea mays]
MGFISIQKGAIIIMYLSNPIIHLMLNLCANIVLFLRFFGLATGVGGSNKELIVLLSSNHITIPFKTILHDEVMYLYNVTKTGIGYEKYMKEEIHMHNNKTCMHDEIWNGLTHIWMMTMLRMRKKTNAEKKGFDAGEIK